MLRFVSCIAVEHNLLFTVAALCICVAGALVFSSLVLRSADRRGTVHAALVLMSGLIGGATVWTTHFVAMLGYRTDLILGYDLVATLGSLLIAVATTTVATAIATSTLRKAGARLGGAILGAGISLMHYAGIVAMQLQGTVAWDPSGVLLSIAAALGFSMLAMDGAGDGTGRSRTIYAAAALVLGISSMHFIGMSAMTVTPAPVNDTVGSVSNEAIALAIVATVSILITLGAATWAIDNANTRDAREGYRYLSLHDPLTSLPNRQHLKLLLEQMISSRGPGEPRAAVAVLELGQLRAVNEVHGRDVGDRILQRFAKRVSTSLSHDEHLGRFDGMSFIAIKSGVGSREEALEFGNRLLTLALTPIAFEGAQDIQVGVSLGVATYPDDASRADELFDRAHFAADQAREMGGNRMCAFQAEAEKQRRSRSALAMDLRGAAARGEFELVYQRQNVVTTEEIVGFEALLRWNHPGQGTISPAVFIPLAEELGIIDAVGEWVLRSACADAAMWPMPLRVAVNVAPAQLANPHFSAIVRRILAASGLDPTRLELEVTETGILTDVTQALETTRQLKALGIAIAMDDYGTGYSSLSMLQKFPFDKIKIDREFISALTANPHSSAIILATIALGRSMQIPVLAEGVENAEQLAFLKGAGCDQVQGFLFGQPMPDDAVARLLRNLKKSMGGRQGPTRSASNVA